MTLYNKVNILNAMELYNLKMTETRQVFGTAVETARDMTAPFQNAKHQVPTQLSEPASC